MESPLFFVSVFLAGILSFFSPCIFPLLPVYIGILLDDKEVAGSLLGKAWLEHSFSLQASRQSSFCLALELDF